MKKIKQILVITLLSSLSLLSCHVNATYNNREEDKSDGERITNQLYTLLKLKNYQQADNLFSKQFLVVTDSGKLNELFLSSENKLGSITNVHLDTCQTERVTGTNPSTKYLFVYTINRSRYPSKESILLTKENDEIKILGYHVNSEGFLK